MDVKKENVGVKTTDWVKLAYSPPNLYIAKTLLWKRLNMT